MKKKTIIECPEDAFERVSDEVYTELMFIKGHLGCDYNNFDLGYGEKGDCEKCWALANEVLKNG